MPKKKPAQPSLWEYMLKEDNQPPVQSQAQARSSRDVIRASEIGSYLYCNRSWWYQRQGIESANQEQLIGGTQMHEAHGQTVVTAGVLRFLAYTLLLTALVLVIIYLSNLFL